jgi:hypothetical protein
VFRPFGEKRDRGNGKESGCFEIGNWKLEILDLRMLRVVSYQEKAAQPPQI